MNFNSDKQMRIIQCIKLTKNFNFSNIREHKGTLSKFGNPLQNLMITLTCHDLQA